MRPHRLSPTRAIVFCPAARLACLAAILLVELPAAGATITWIGGSGQWDVASNWSPGGQPQAGNDVNLTQSDATSRTVTYYNTTNPTALLNSLTIDATGSGTMTLNMPNNHQLKVTTEYVGYNGKGFVTRSAGTNSAATLYLGYNTGGDGTYTSTGGTLSSSGTQYIGYSGVGTLNIEAGGQISSVVAYLGFNSGSTGTATVTGAGSKWTAIVYVGRSGSGTLNIEKSGVVSSSYGYINGGSGTTCTATVNGIGSKWTSSGTFMVAGYGNNTLNIEAGGEVSNTTGRLDGVSGSPGTATVMGSGSKWTNSSNLYVGDTGSGTLNIKAGGQVSNAVGFIGGSAGSTGTATVTGADSKWTNGGSLYVGYHGSGTLTVTDGGLVTATMLYASVSDLFGNGTITVTKSAILDGDMVFDGAHGGGTQTFIPFGAGGKVILTVDPTGILGAGYKRTGTLRIADGVTVASSTGHIGTESGSTGTVTVIGTGSKWTNSDCLYVGNSGSGTLNVEAGGQISSAVAWLGNGASSTGTVTVTATGSKWTNSGELRVGSWGSGTLNIENGGQVTNNYYSYVGYYSGSSGTVTVTGADSKWTNGDFLYVGESGNGTLNIEAGGEVTTGWPGLIGHKTGSTGAVTVTGAGSKWTSSSSVNVGNSGIGTLKIQAGGEVTCSEGSIAHNPTSTGRATVTGADAVWTISDGLSVGASGSGTLTLADGGKVTAKSVSVNDKSAVRLHVSGSNMLVSGTAAATGSIGNSGTVSFYADSFLAADTYTPISEYAGRAMTWSGTGSYKAYGGTWDNAAKTFTVAAATALMAGATETISPGERLLFSDPGSGQHVGASFGSITGSPTFSASPMSHDELAALALMPGFEGLVLSAWDFDTDLTGGDAVLLSFAIGLGAQDVGIWHYKGGVWGQYAADLLTYDCNGILSFTVTDFSGYAVTAVPEPATLALLATGAAGALLHRRRRR